MIRAAVLFHGVFPRRIFTVYILRMNPKRPIHLRCTGLMVVFKGLSYFAASTAESAAGAATLSTTVSVTLSATSSATTDSATFESTAESAAFLSPPQDTSATLKRTATARITFFIFLKFKIIKQYFLLSKTLQSYNLFRIYNIHDPKKVYFATFLTFIKPQRGLFHTS